METTKLKRFATEARVNLMEGVKRKLRLLGFDDRGNPVSEPQLVQGATLWKGEEYPEVFYNQWKTLQQRLSEKGIREVTEEAAYTWFNRMMAIRILSMNGFCEPILRIDLSTGLPNLLANARMGRIPEMNIQQKHRFEVLMDDDTKSYEQFALLLTAWCHDNPIINTCFGSINDYVELLLPDNILRPDGFISLLNETDFISEEDYKSAELIGWLYQFYISDRKDEVFAKKGKVEAEEIPAATQIFTPNWIVKYMVQNTILPQVYAPEEIIEKAKYLVKVEGADNRKVELEDLKVADFACGSGHILNECFDLLFELYRSEAYSRKEAVEYIFTKNLTGIDIDLRAKQLATFSLLLKACQKDESFIDAHCLPHVITVPSNSIADREIFFVNGEFDARDFIPHFFLGSQTNECKDQLIKAFDLIHRADILGSIIKFEISPSTRRQIAETVSFWKNQEHLSEGIRVGLPIMDFILTLTEFYDAIVMNPPYMPTNKVDGLKEYAIENYPDSKTDLFSVFMEVCWDRLKQGGKYGMINMQSWMFLSSFETLRKKIINEQQIDSLLHLGPRTFDELSGEVVQNVAFVIAKIKNNNKSIYYRLIYGANCSTKESMFLNPEEIDTESYDRKVLYEEVEQSEFSKIPGSPFAYWATKTIFDVFDNNKSIEEFYKPGIGLSTGDNDKFLRNWFEVSFRKIKFNSESHLDSFNNNYKYFPYNKGGSYRKWYGNRDIVVNWQNDGEQIKQLPNSVIRNPSRYFESCITFPRIGGDKFSARYCESGFIFDCNGPCCFPYDNYEYVLAFLNSSVMNDMMRILCPTLSFQIGDSFKAPFINKKDDIIIQLCKDCIKISKEDWDSHEKSWDFKINELVAITIDHSSNNKFKIEDSIRCYIQKWTDLFFKLHANETEINKRFIDIYDLKNDLIPDIFLGDITILQDNEISINYEGPFCGTLKFNTDVIIQQLISYIIGVYMGRYRLDKPGLHISYPDPSDEDLAPYSFEIPQQETFTIDPDAIIPILPKDAPFYDNLYNYIVEFIGKVWGQDELTQNLNFIEKALGKRLEDYLLKDFWKDHKKMYQNRPIYWEFASKKGAFKAIIYAHRMDKYTIEVLRSKYVLPYIKFIENKISTMESREQELSTKERRELDNLRTKILPELEEYHSRVEQVAAETAARPQVFDLDDGIPHNHSLFGDIVTKLK